MSIVDTIMGPRFDRSISRHAIPAHTRKPWANMEALEKLGDEIARLDGVLDDLELGQIDSEVISWRGQGRPAPGPGVERPTSGVKQSTPKSKARARKKVAYGLETL